jgi:hypothetical protein
LKLSELNRENAAWDLAETMQTVPSYAVIFKAFFFDKMVDRRLKHVCLKAQNGDVYLVIDETNKEAGEIAYENVVRVTEKQLINAGLPDYPAGQIFWYNADYQLYHCLENIPKYDYYVMIEYDAVPNYDLDLLVSSARSNAIDFIAQPIETPVADWKWTASCQPAFETSAILPYLLCVAVFSRQALEALRARRLALSEQFKAGEIKVWPMAEGFVASELARTGATIRHLADYGRLERYDVWPPYHERSLPLLADETFVHPVLTGRRYLRVLLRNGLPPALRAQCDFLLSRRSTYSPLWTARSAFLKTVRPSVIQHAPSSRQV